MSGHTLDRGIVGTTTTYNRYQQCQEALTCQVHGDRICMSLGCILVRTRMQMHGADVSEHLHGWCVWPFGALADQGGGAHNHCAW